MKIKDILQLSTKNLRAHFKRSLMIIIVIGSIFGLILAINLWFQGVKKSYIKLVNYATDGKVIIEATSNTNEIITDDALSRTTLEEIMADIKTYGGKVLGKVEKFGVFGSIVLPGYLMQNAIEADLSKVPADAAPVLASTFFGEQLLGKSFSTERTSAMQKQKDYEEFRSSLIGKTFADTQGAKYYVVGLTSDNFHVRNLAFSQLERTNHNLLNPILEMITTPEGLPIVIDNGKTESWQSGKNIESDFILPMTADEAIIAVFDCNSDAYNYFRHSKGKFINVDFPNRTYSVNVIAGPSPETQYVINIIQAVINFSSVILGIVAATIVIFTSIRLVNRNESNIALYYNLGATTRQVQAIYLCYFLELIIGAIVFAFVLASLVVLSFSLINQELLAIQSALGYNLKFTSKEIWYGIGINTIIAIICMLFLSLICVVANHKNLKNRN